MIKLENDEKLLISSIIFNYFASIVQNLAVADNKKDAETLFAMAKSIEILHADFFLKSLEGDVSLSKEQNNFLISLLEKSKNTLEEVKIAAVKNGDGAGFEIASTIEILNNIILKLPKQSVIIA